MQCLVASDIHRITPALRRLFAPLGTIRYLPPGTTSPRPTLTKRKTSPPSARKTSSPARNTAS